MGNALVFRRVMQVAGGAIYLHSMPGRYEPMAQFERACREQAVTRILCLTGREEITQKSAAYGAWLECGANGIEVLEFAVADFSVADDLPAYAKVIRALADAVQAGESVLIHCAAGIGRTGTAAICLLLSMGETLHQASQSIKAAGSGPETPEQEAFIGHYADVAELFEIRAFKSDDFERVQHIYLQGIATGHATFQTERKNWSEWQCSMTEDCRLVVCNGLGELVGWAGLSAISSREVYRGVAEVSVYIANSAQGKGLGKLLLKALIEASERAGYWTLQAAIFPENEASIALHLSCGFCVLGRREKLGKMHAVWRDVMLLERRSDVVGVE
ncbi:MAG: GNAT family N-acetyltransferase [Pseudomonadales bacterium]